MSSQRASPPEVITRASQTVGQSLRPSCGCTARESFEARCAGVACAPHRHTLLQKILVVACGDQSGRGYGPYSLKSSVCARDENCGAIFVTRAHRTFEKPLTSILASMLTLHALRDRSVKRPTALY